MGKQNGWIKLEKEGRLTSTWGAGTWAVFRNCMLVTFNRVEHSLRVESSAGATISPSFVVVCKRRLKNGECSVAKDPAQLVDTILSHLIGILMQHHSYLGRHAVRPVGGPKASGPDRRQRQRRKQLRRQHQRSRKIR